MSHEIQEAILDFISQNASTINQLSITWYGGEPLLSFDLIKDFSKKVINRQVYVTIRHIASESDENYKEIFYYGLYLCIRIVT